MSEPRTYAQTCTDHCSSCGEHFHGLGAFDRHLRRSSQRLNGYGAPEYNLDHVVGAEVGLQAWTTTGRCDLTGERQEPVTVWQVIPSAQALAFWAKHRQEPVSSDIESRHSPENASGGS